MQGLYAKIKRQIIILSLYGQIMDEVKCFTKLRFLELEEIIQDDM